MGKDANKNNAGEIEKKDKEPLPEDVLPPELAKRIPQDVRQEVIALFMRSGPVPSPLSRVITSEHVDQVISNTENESNRNFRFAISGRRYSFAVFLILLGAAGALLYGFSDKPQVFTPILTALLGFGAGFGVGKPR